MLTFQADSSNFVNTLQRAEAGDEICLTPGEYKGPFTIDRAVTIRGNGSDTIIWTVDEPALLIKVPGVRIENLAIQRTVGGDKGEVVLLADPDTSPILDRVSLLGIAENVQWEGASWNIPAVIDFGEIETNRQVQRSWQLQIGAPCEILSDLNWLYVQPSHLSPGLQNLEIVFNSREILAGTKLSGFIFLETPDEKRKIEIFAQIIAFQQQNLGENSHSRSTGSKAKIINDSTSEDWGYRFVGEKAIAKFIRDVEGSDANIKYPDFHQRRDRASELMSELLNRESCLFYVRRKGSGQEAGEEKWELIIATDINNIKLPKILEEREKTLSLLAVVSENKSGGLRLLSAQLVPRERGRSDGFSVLCRVRLLSDRQYRKGVPPEIISRIATLPCCGDRLLTEDQLQAWTTFVEIERRLAEARQFCVPFLSHDYGSNRRQIIFEIDATEATIDGSLENSISEEDFWKRAFKTQKEEIKFFKSSPEGKGGRDAQKLGRIAEVDSQLGQIRVRLDDDSIERLNQKHYQFPETGFLLFDAFGEISQIKHKERALNDLQNGRTQNPYLGEFFFDASKARIPRKLVKLQPQDLLLPSANPDQIAAVETVLSAKDLILIQGPPGTGKTTVIAEICYQVARLGGRTLIASQANLAVDNALSRLVHNPLIRALRKGKAEKVQEEGQPFLEEQVIGTWLQNTADDCDKGLAKRRENINFYGQVLVDAERFNRYIQAEEAIATLLQQLPKQKANLEETCKAQEKIYKEAEVQQSQIESLILEWESLLSTQKVNWENPAIANFLPRLQPYAEGDSSVRYFIDNVKVAIKLAGEIGFILPSLGAFGLAAWLRETVAASMSEFRTALADANQAIAALAEFQEAVQVYEKDSASLEEMRKNYQQNLATHKNLQQKIQSLKSSKAEIDSVIKNVKIWLDTSQARVYETLKRCLRSRQPFSEELMQLPPGLVAIAHSVNLPLLPSYGTNAIDALPEWERLGKALEMEAKNNFIDLLGKQYRFSEFLHVSLRQQPMVLSASDRTPWLEIAEQFKNYPSYTKSQRQNLVDNTRQFLNQKQQMYGASWEPNQLESTLKGITEEVINVLLTNARLCVSQVKADTEKRLQDREQELNEFQTLIANLHKEGTAARQQVEISSKEADSKYKRVIQLLQKLHQQPQLPENLRSLTEQCIQTPSKISERSPQLSTQLHSWESRVNQLETLISSLEPLAVLSIIKNRLSDRLFQLKQETESAKTQLAHSQNQLREIESQFQPQNLPESLIVERSWWEKAWQTISDRFKLDIPPTGLFELDFLRKLQAQFDSWKQELAKEQAYLNRYQNLVQDWVDKLRNPSEQDRNELKQIYLDNANVIGITCVQAARREFSEEFKNFDVVIIDEVSKCTPPEILIPALKGKRLVLVGDHRQLPPMLNDNTVEDIAKELGSPPDELKFLEESLFKIQFEAAADSIKQMLTIQYRMHPNIMGAINQFYQHRLQCGLPNPDQKRAHNLAGPIIQNNQHLIWVKMPLAEGFEEKKQGTSPFNVREVDVIERLCQQMEASWSPKIARGEPPKEIGIITFYLAQLELIENRIDPDLYPSLHIRTGTVDRFQGMERQVIIVSMVRNNREGKVGFARKPERVNVAFSRAQELLVIVGCHSLFTEHSGHVGNMYSEVSNVVRRQGGLIDVSNILG